MLKTLSKINWKYALGEIIIVIIGITIAFSLNKYAENASSQSNKRKYLQSLKKDIDNERVHLSENIGKFEQKLASIKQLFPMLFGNKAGRDTMYQKVFDLAQIINFLPHDVTYKTLINSGDLHLFKSFELRKAIEEHYASYVFLEQDYGRQNNINEKYFADFMIYEINYAALRSGDYSFMDNTLLRNIIQSLYGTYTISIKSSKKGIERCDALEKLLDQALQE